MYRSASQVWHGLAKNAREGLGAPGLIWVWTVLLFGGQVLPFVVFAGCASRLTLYGLASTFPPPDSWFAEARTALLLSAAACLLAYLPRLDSARQFRASRLSAILHPVGILVLLAIQWYATVRHWVGRPVGWKGRPHPRHTSSSSAAA